VFTGFLFALLTNFHPFLVSKDLLKQYILYLIDLFKSEETKSKIGRGVKEGWRRRREKIKDSIDEKEKLRRLKISRANKGNIPWIKGKKHSPGWITPIFRKEKLLIPFQL
jgi:NUMOD3 motif